MMSKCAECAALLVNIGFDVEPRYIILRGITARGSLQGRDKEVVKKTNQYQVGPNFWER